MGRFCCELSCKRVWGKENHGNTKSQKKVYSDNGMQLTEVSWEFHLSARSLRTLKPSCRMIATVAEVRSETTRNGWHYNDWVC